jgi:hypothetical protein
MQQLTTDLITQACRVFLALAYPGGETDIPAKKRCVLAMPPGQNLLDHLANDVAVNECCTVARRDGKVRAIWLRLGCNHYPHLKLKIQLLEHKQGDIWLFGVDSHDKFSANYFVPPPGHPEADAWMKLQAQNRMLKERIETAWEQAGVATFNSQMRRDLDQRWPSFA